jgi:signal transduction histidine kinase
MAEQGMGIGSRSGPGNKRIATTFLESLSVRGQAAAHDRALRALGLADGRLADASTWLPEDVIGRMFVAAETDPSHARSVGHRLIAPDATGLALYGLGLATPEKAYRRLQALLPRDRPDAQWSVNEIGSGCARIAYSTPAEENADEPGPNRSHSGSGGGRADESLCALRVGMLEAVPGLFGLLPARVTQTSCLSEGADACRYRIEWKRGSMLGLQIGGGIGLGLTIGFIVSALGAGPGVFPLSAGVFVGLICLGMTTALGRSIDLHQQLEAVAGARRGHLALFDQVDDALATKLDTLARVDAKLEVEASSPRVTRVTRVTPDADEDAEPNRSGRSADGDVQVGIQKIHTSAGDLECWFEGAAADSLIGEGAFDEGRSLVREIRTWAKKISEDGETEELRSQEPVDLVRLVKRAVVAARPLLPQSVVIHVDHDDDLKSIVCEAVQIEQVVVQLLRNAAEASSGLSEAPEVFVSIRQMNSGVELAVEDRGVGIESSELDEVFDPFFDDRRAGVDQGFGLPVCLRIVERHGGELRIEAEDRAGTRVSVLLPESFEPNR